MKGQYAVSKIYCSSGAYYDRISHPAFIFFDYNKKRLWHAEDNSADNGNGSKFSFIKNKNSDRVKY